MTWENSAAVKEFAFLKALFGEPSHYDGRTGGLAVWNHSVLSKAKLFKRPVCFVEYVLKDEAVHHKFPSEHYDNQYAYVEVDIEPQTLEYVLSLSGSVSYDPLKGWLYARCGTLMANIATLYLAMRIIENPARLRSIQQNGVYGKLLALVHDPKGIHGANMKKLGKVYAGMCRMRANLPSKNRGYWRGAFSKDGGPPLIGGKYAGDVRNASRQDFLKEKRALAKARAASARAARLEGRPQPSARIPTKPVVLKTVQVDGIRLDGEPESSGTPDYLDYVHEDPSAAGSTEPNALTPEAAIALKQMERGKRIGSDIQVNLAQVYDDVHMRGLTDQVAPEMSNMNLNLEENYEDVTMRDVQITSVEPFTRRPEGMATTRHDNDFQKTYNTDNWAQQLAQSEQNERMGAFGGNVGRNSAREYFCGRRQYNPDIPPCEKDELHRRHPNYFSSGNNCDPCNGYVKRYDAGLVPGAKVDPPCYYGRRHDPYVDVAAYTRHYEDNAHDPAFYKNFY